MRTLVLLAALIPLHAAHLSRMEQVPTDQRIAACQKALASAPGDPAALEDLAAAYLQKMRETTDFTYVDRADKLVSQALQRKPGDLEGEVLRNEIELNRHHFAKVVENTAALVKMSLQ